MFRSWLNILKRDRRSPQGLQGAPHVAVSAGAEPAVASDAVEVMTLTPFRFDDVRVEPANNELQQLDTGATHRLEPRTMQVLVLLALNAGQLVSRQTFIDTVWPGRRVVDDSLSQCISELRRALGDSARAPRYIRTVPKRGYMLLPAASWEVPAQSGRAQAAQAAPQGRRRPGRALPVGLVVLALLGIASLPLLLAPGRDTGGDVGAVPQTADIMALLVPSARATDTLHWATQAAAGEAYRVRRVWEDDARARLEIRDQAGVVVWSAVRNTATAEQQRSAAAELSGVLGLIEVQRTAAALGALPPQQLRLFRRARYLVDRRTQQDLATARDLIEQVLAQEPAFVDAILLLAEVQRGLGGYDRSEGGPVGYRAAYDALVARARQLAPQHPAVRAISYSPGAGEIDWQAYERDLLELVDEAPDCLDCVERLARFYLQVGWIGEAVAVWEQLISYWPLSVRVHASLALLYARSGDAESTLREVRMIAALAGTDSWDVRVAELNAYHLLGDAERWLDSGRRLLTRRGELGALRIALFEAIVADDDAALARLAQREELRGVLNITLNLGLIEQAVSLVEAAVAEGRLNELALVHGWLHPREHAINRRYLGGLARLRAHPRVQSLFEAVGLRAFWQQRGRLPDYCYGDAGNHAPKPSYCRLEPEPLGAD